VGPVSDSNRPNRRASRRPERLLRIARLLQTQTGLTANQLAELADASRRTVFRDLALIADCGFAWSYDRRIRSYHMANDTASSFAGLSDDEVDAIMLGLENLNQRHISPRPSAVDSAKAKLLESLPKPLRSRWEHLDGKVRFDFRPVVEGASVHDIFVAIQSCLLGRKFIVLEFEGPTKVHRRGLYSPIALVHSDRAWHVVASRFSERGQHPCAGNDSSARTTLPNARHAPRMHVTRIPLHRITRYKVSARSVSDRLQEVCSGLRGGDLTGGLNGQFRVVIDFASAVASEVSEVTWFPDQIFQRKLDGSLRFEANVTDLGSVARWIQRYGAQAAVVSPSELKARVAKRMRRTQDHCAS